MLCAAIIYCVRLPYAVVSSSSPSPSLSPSNTRPPSPHVLSLAPLHTPFSLFVRFASAFLRFPFLRGFIRFLFAFLFCQCLRPAACPPSAHTLVVSRARASALSHSTLTFRACSPSEPSKPLQAPPILSCCSHPPERDSPPLCPTCVSFRRATQSAPTH